ncbi:MAG: hypothetical protein ACI4LS_03510 [Treponema sp.]
MKITKKITVIITTLSAFLLGSCTIGLGEAIDLIGPSVTILTPEPRQCVKAAGFDITAKVTDDFAVKTITVECNGNSWVGQKGAWQVKTSDSSTYQADPLSTWSVDSDGKTVNFTIKSIKIPLSGTYNLSVTATDAANNISEESKKIRTVIVDTDPPKVTVSNPALYPATTDSIEKLNAITDYRKITEVSKFVTGDFTLSGTTVDENTIEYIDVIIKETETDIVYLEKRLIKDTQFAEDKSCIELNSLRAWEFPVKLADYPKFASLDASKHMFTVITCSRDSSGNREDTYVHGIFCMWKDADQPWIEMKLGDKSSPLSVYAGTTINGTAYDDTEISEVTSTVKENDSSGAIVSQDILYERGTKVSENTIFYQLPVPKDCTTYYIEINAKDNNGKTAVSKTGYIEVVDKTFPSVELKHYIDETEKQIDQPLFGNKDGDFALEFIAKDDTDIKHVKVAYVTNKDDIVTLSNTNAEQWNSPAYAASSVSELKNGKIYTLSDLNEDGKETDPVFGITRLRYKTKVNLNLFDDLGINGITRTLSNQTFVVLVEDGNGNKIVKTYTILGDITPPSITFEKIKYNNTFYTNTNTLLPAFDSESEVTVYGSFTDDSAATWLNVQKLNFTLECNGTKVEPDGGQETFKLTDEGKFEVTVKNLIGSSLSFRATVSDLARNTTIQDFGFLVDTNTPRVEYFYATNPDGNYGIDDDITLKLRFNKEIKFIPASGSSELPEITLNNVKKVKMTTDANTLTREFNFNYKIETGDDIPALNVKSIDLKGGSIQDSNGSEISDVETLINESWANNLNSRKSICIITCKPEINAVVFDENTGTVTISFTRTIQKGNGKIIISQKEDGLRIPPVLSIAQYKVIAAKNSTLKNAYELSSNGANPNNNWETDITPKYVLKYDINCNDLNLVKEYIKTSLHKITQDVKSNACTLSSDDTITVKIGSLPCKGAQFDVTIEENFIYDRTGGTAYGNQAYNTTYNSTGVELPVIRIKSQKATVSNYAANYSNCLNSTFKIDCQSPNSKLTYSYDTLTRTATTYSVTNQYDDGNTQPNRANYSKQSTNSTDYKNPIEIGSSNYEEGLTFHITATATSALNKNHTESNYASISRTTIELKDLNHPMSDSGLTNNANAWPYTENPHICAFLKGGDNPNGPNTTQGLPTDWDVKNTEQCLLLQVSGNNYYTVSWDITSSEYYFKVYAGLMDSETFANGPKAGIALQNCWVGGYSKYYVIPGEYMVINNKTNGGTGEYTNTDFEFENGGLKCQIYR